VRSSTAESSHVVDSVAGKDLSVQPCSTCFYVFVRLDLKWSYQVDPCTRMVFCGRKFVPRLRGHIVVIYAPAAAW